MKPGMFLSATRKMEDTYRGETNEPDTWHLYAYCANNPVNYTDPSGHQKNRVSIYYVNGSNDFYKQAYSSCYYKENSSDLKKVTYTSQFKKVWNNLKSNTTEIYLFLHGGEGVLYFKGVNFYNSQIKKLSYKNLKNVNKLYILTCKGAKGGKKSVAYTFHSKMKKAKAYAAKCKISYRLDTKGRWHPRRGGKKYAFSTKNPVQRVY